MIKKMERAYATVYVTLVLHVHILIVYRMPKLYRQDKLKFSLSTRHFR